MTNQCNHGQLRRQCEVCDLTARLAEAERRSELESTQEAELDMVLPLKKTRPRGMQAIRDDRARRAIALIDDLRERLTDCNLAYMDARENYKVELARAIRDRDELRAEVARLLVVAEKVPHSRKCSIRAPHAATMDYKPTCNCPRGQLLAMLKETTNGPY